MMTMETQDKEMTEVAGDREGQRKRGNIGRWRKFYRWLSGMGLATGLLVLMAVLTWLATLEQVDYGLHATLERYFSWRELVVFPRVGGMTIWLPLPTGYWVGVLLVVNMALGGVVHIRKGWKSVGNLVAHIGILMMLVAGGVAHHWADHSNMVIPEGSVCDFSQDVYEYTVEVAEWEDGKVKAVRVIRMQDFDDLAGGEQRTFEFPGWAIRLTLADFYGNAAVVSGVEQAPPTGVPLVSTRAGEVGYWIYPMKKESEAQRNRPACYAKVEHRDGSKEHFILAGASFYPHTIREEGKVYTVDMRKRVYAMPMKLRLDRFTMEMHPGTNKPKRFVSEVTKLEDGYETKAVIQMNEPLRTKGLTIYQASYDMGSGKKSSIFEVVSNPADRWPEYSLYVVSVGMLMTFVTKFIQFLIQSSRKKHHE